MAAPKVHDMTGRHCAGCGKPFTATSMTLTIPTREAAIITHRRVCIACYEHHYQQGE